MACAGGIMNLLLMQWLNIAVDVSFLVPNMVFLLLVIPTTCITCQLGRWNQIESENTIAKQGDNKSFIPSCEATAPKGNSPHLNATKEIAEALHDSHSNINERRRVCRMLELFKHGLKLHDSKQKNWTLHSTFAQRKNTQLAAIYPYTSVCIVVGIKWTTAWLW